MSETLKEKREKARKKAQARINARQSVIIAAQDDPTQLGAYGRGVARGATFNFGDELIAAGKGVAGGFNAFMEDSRTLKEGGQPGSGQDWARAGKDAYDVSMLESKANALDDRSVYPKTAFAGELTGGAVSGYGGVKGLNAIPALSKMGLAKYPLMGGIEGSIHGFGAGESGNRLATGTFGGATGAALTPLLAGVGVSAMSILRPTARRLGEALTGTPRDRAIKEIRKALDADDITPQEADVLMSAMGVNSTMADLGDTLMRQGRLVTSELGPGASQAKRFLDSRQRMAQMELRQTARKATGSNNFDKGIIEVINGAETKAKPIYDEVFSAVLDLSPVMSSLLSRPAMVSARKQAEKMLRDEGFSSEIINDVTDVRYMDAVKRALGDMESSALRSGNNNRARVLGQLRRDFVSEIDAQVPDYAKARSIFAGEAAMKDAAEVGRTMFVGRKDITDIAEQIAGMGESELTAARMGFLRWLSDDLANQSLNSNRTANKFADVPKFRQLIQVLFPDQAAVDDFIKTASAQGRFAQTRNAVTGGSPTARIAADRDALNPGFLAVAADAAINPTSGLNRVMKLISGNTKLTPEVMTAMGEILFDPRIVPSQALKPRLLGPNLFEIPRMAPGSTAAVTGGLIGSQQDDILGLLGSSGLLEEQ